MPHTRFLGNRYGLLRLFCGWFLSLILILVLGLFLFPRFLVVCSYVFFSAWCGLFVGCWRWWEKLLIDFEVDNQNQPRQDDEQDQPSDFHCRIALIAEPRNKPGKCRIHWNHNVQ